MSSLHRALKQLTPLGQPVTKIMGIALSFFPQMRKSATGAGWLLFLYRSRELILEVMQMLL